MTEIIIRDVPIKFPFKPYKVQEDYMSKVLECLQNGVNGVLESPTGTGKTLSLLCASLAWLQLKRARQQHDLNTPDVQDLHKSVGPSQEAQDGATWSKMAAPYIVYASRTHSQLTQVMKELRRTSYCNVKATVLGSREQLCLHPDLTLEQSFMKVTLCRAKMKAKTCHYYNNLEVMRNSGDKSTMLSEVTDIEDLVKFGQRTQCCPYYLARDSMSDADILFMPYNYLLDPHTRRAQKITLNNAVVILDEAHNVEGTCEDAASVSISSTDIAHCITDVTQAMKKYAEIDKMNEIGSGEEVTQDLSMEELCVLKSMFLALEAAMDEIQLSDPKNGDKPGATFPGTYIFKILSKAEIVMDKLISLDECLTKLVQFISRTSDSLPNKGSALTKFNDFLQVVYESCADGDESASELYYKVHVEQELGKKSKADSWSSVNITPNNKAKIINYWCFSSRFAMRSMMKQGVHSVILTSGTLVPLQATVSELGIPVPVTLENPHIIQPSQVSVTVMSKGPTGERLISNFSNRENPQYLSDLGGVISNLSRVIPDGILVFFTSYPVMNKAIDCWQQQGHYSNISALKPVFVEPQRRESFLEVLCDYKNAIEADGSRGAVLLAVLRGKVAEGIDFADTHARAVLITGLPYSPYKDPQVFLKQEYLDNARKINGQGLTGRQWYELDAVRAVNQAVGRLIRHANDFGSILLCDCRFNYPSIYNTLPAWIRSQLVHCDEFGLAFSRVTRFFKALGLFPPRAAQSGASFDCVKGKVRTKEATKEMTNESKSETVLSKTSSFEKFQNTELRNSVQPSSSGGLMEALRSTKSTQTPVDILKSVYNNGVIDSCVQPAPKKQKLRLVPLNIDKNSDECPDVAGTRTDNCLTLPNSTEESVDVSDMDYLTEVKQRLSAEKYAEFKETINWYTKTDQPDYNRIILNLQTIFPDSSTRDLFKRFERYIRKEDVDKFRRLFPHLAEIERVVRQYSQNSDEDFTSH